MHPARYAGEAMDHEVPHSIDAIRRVLARRRPLFEQRSAVRLSHHELTDRLTIDDYAGHLLLTDYLSRTTDNLARLADELLEALSAEGLAALGATLKQRPDNLSHANRDADDAARAIHLAGVAPPPQIEVVEDDRRFIASFERAGFGTGIFLDMAEGRRAVRALAASHQHVLNLFSYTGGFSIAAAQGGAERVIEADTSNKWLAWAREHQQINDVKIVRQRREDAVRLLARQADDAFDLIVCDPPSYAKSRRGQRFTIEAGYRAMEPHFARVLRDGGRLLACCNHAGTSGDQFRNWFTPPLRFERCIDLPGDFPGADYLKIALLRNGA